jgi:hypothetical protein
MLVSTLGGIAAGFVLAALFGQRYHLRTRQGMAIIAVGIACQAASVFLVTAGKPGAALFGAVGAIATVGGLAQFLKGARQESR